MRTKSLRVGTNRKRKYDKTYQQEARCFFVWENQRFSLNFFNLSALNSIKKVDENPDDKTQYIKCDHCDNNSYFKYNLRKHSMTKQNKHNTNIPFNCDVYQEHHDSKNCPTNHDKCTSPS